MKGASTLKLGCCVGVELLPIVAEAGFDFAELRCESTLPSEGKERWESERDRLLSYGVPIRSFNVLLPNELKVIGPDVSMNALRDYLSTVFYRISELGGEHVSFGSGSSRMVPDGFERTRAEEQLVSFIELMYELAKPYSIQINIELINRKDTNIIVSLLEADKYARIINRDSVKVLADLYHMMEEHEPFYDLERVATNIGYVHVADTGRLYPGSGDYPFGEFFETLHRIGYDGPVSVECIWNTDPVAEMRASARYLRSFLEK
jgi:sugar phosphate isomerase/epimerase